MPQPAFLLFGTSPQAAQELRESFRTRIAAVYPQVQWRDVSSLTFMDISLARRTLKEQGLVPTVYVKESSLPRSITEAWLKTNSTYGMLRQLREGVIVLHRGVQEMVTHAMTMLEAEGQAPKPKETTEVDRLRIQQKQENLLAKKRQTDQMLSAQERELQKKSRDQERKITQPKTGAKQE